MKVRRKLLCKASESGEESSQQVQKSNNHQERSEARKRCNTAMIPTNSRQSP